MTPIEHAKSELSRHRDLIAILTNARDRDIDEVGRRHDEYCADLARRYDVLLDTLKLMIEHDHAYLRELEGDAAGRQLGTTAPGLPAAGAGGVTLNQFDEPIDA